MFPNSGFEFASFSNGSPKRRVNTYMIIITCMHIYYFFIILSSVTFLLHKYMIIRTITGKKRGGECTWIHVNVRSQDGPAPTLRKSRGSKAKDCGRIQVVIVEPRHTVTKLCGSLDFWADRQQNHVCDDAYDMFSLSMQMCTSVCVDAAQW